MRKLLTLTTLALLALGTGCASLSGDHKQKVVYHINYNDEAQLKAALGNVKNHMSAVGQDKIEIIVVVHGNGVDLLKIANTNLDMQQKVIGLKKDGVAFEVCNNTLVNKKINYKNDLFDVSEKDIVPSGVAEVANLQQKGYVYIKP
jgi:uncharacterized protein